MSVHTYWLSFRFNNDANRDRYNNFLKEVSKTSKTKPWDAPTSFLIITSDQSMISLFNHFKLYIDHDHDVLFMGEPGEIEVLISGESTETNNLRNLSNKFLSC